MGQSLFCVKKIHSHWEKAWGCCVMWSRAHTTQSMTRWELSTHHPLEHAHSSGWKHLETSSPSIDEVVTTCNLETEQKHFWTVELFEAIFFEFSSNGGESRVARVCVSDLQAVSSTRRVICSHFFSTSPCSACAQCTVHRRNFECSFLALDMSLNIELPSCKIERWHFGIWKRRKDWMPINLGRVMRFYDPHEARPSMNYVTAILLKR